MKERTRARPATIHHRAYLATVCRPAARKGGLREARVGFGIRLRLPQDRRRGLFRYHASGSARRVDRAGVIDTLREVVLEAYDRLIGLELSEVAVDCCITKAPCGGQKAGRSPVDRGKQGIKRSTAVDAEGIPIGGVTDSANRHDSPLLVPTLEHACASVGGLPEGASVHLDRGYDSKTTRERLEERGLISEISQKGKPSSLGATKRWVVERTSSWHNAHKRLVRRTERRGQVYDFWVAFSEVVIIVRRLIREGWICYRWEGRPSRQP